MKDFTFRLNTNGDYDVLEIDAGQIKLGRVKVLRTVATFGSWDEALICTKSLNAAEEAK